MIDVSESINLSRHEGIESDILALETSNRVTIGKWYYSTDYLLDPTKLLSIFVGVAPNLLLKLPSDGSNGYLLGLIRAMEERLRAMELELLKRVKYEEHNPAITIINTNFGKIMGNPTVKEG